MLRHKNPMMEMLQAAQGNIRMHMPGHKGRLPAQWLDATLDMTELDLTDDLFAPNAGIARAQEAAAQSAGAASTLMLTGGATAGVLTMLLHILRRGDRIILPRTAHVSALSGLILSGAEPIYVWPRFSKGLPYVDAMDVLAAIKENPDAKAVLVTRPDYFGQSVELRNIAEACHKNGMALLVDEAHGAHWNWGKEPQNAGAYGADLFVQSAHKTLPVLTGGAWLHAGEKINADDLRRTLRLVHSSSPNFLVMQSLDAARAWMEEQGEAALQALSARVQDFWEQIEGGGRFANAHRYARVPVDPLRVVVDVSKARYTGHAAMRALQARGVTAEMADSRRVVLIPTVFDAPEDLRSVAAAFLSLPKGREKPPREREARMPISEQAVSFSVAARAKAESVPFEQAAGRVAAATIGLYPPGVPLFMPGERIAAEQIAYFCEEMRAGATPFGVADTQIPCISEGEPHALQNPAL